MTAIDYLNEQGFSARLANSLLIVSPSSKLSPELRGYIKSHRLELIDALAVSNEPTKADPILAEVRIALPLIVNEQQRIVVTAATASPEWIAARNQWHNHLAACKACYAPKSRYCLTGAELRQRYNSTAME